MTATTNRASAAGGINGFKKPTQGSSSIDNVPKTASYSGFDHVTWYVSNARQAASYFVTRMGFKILAFRGLETGSKAITSVVVSNNAVIFVFTSALRPSEGLNDEISDAEKQLIQKIHGHVAKHGDAVSDVAFGVDNVVATFDSAVHNGATGLKKPMNVSDDSGQVTLAVLQTFGDTTHTLVERSQYRGVFLPGFVLMEDRDPVNEYLPKIKVEAIDHCVGNQDWNDLRSTAEYYEKCLGFRRYWTVDDVDMCTEYSAMNSVVVTSPNGGIKMPLNEPAYGRKKSQIEEFVKYNGGAGVQHIALRTPNIIDCVTNLKRRGLQFIEVPGEYYEELRARLNHSDVRVEEDLNMLKNLSILVDFDEGGYLLQLFTKPITDRPTVFLEIIQRNNFDGFGAGNFKALFQAIEREQAKRGEL